MNTIDERVVQMRFDNKQFESGVKTSVDSLNQLKKGLDLDAAANSLSNLDKVGRSFSLAGIADGVQNLSNKFSALGIMGITVLQNLTNSAINTGKNLISSLTIDPIKTGLDLYETKINAIQTILTNTASAGTNINDVTQALNELNDYSNQTIYNFGEMTRNIGTFTAAGVDLKTSVTAIKGIANLAAGSGSSAQQASMAMYQLSQALASGTVKLMDWNSVVNAGMGGQLFQKALEKTAVELGKGRDMSVSFRDSLQDGWLTTEVLTKTLEKFANDKSLIQAATQVKTFSQLMDVLKETVASGWAVSWENILGNKDEAAKLFTAINDGFSEMTSKSTDARNAMLAFWKANGGRDAIIQSLADAFEGLRSVFVAMSGAFTDIFPPTTGQQLVDISNSIKAFSENFKMGVETASNLHRTFAGLFALLDIGKQAIFALGNGLSSLIQYLLPAGKGFLSFTGDIGDFLVYLDKAIKTSNLFNIAIQKIGSFMEPMANWIKNSVSTIINSFKSFGGVDLSGLDSFMSKIQISFQPFTNLGAKLSGVLTVLYKFSGIIGKLFKKMEDSITGAFDNVNLDSAFKVITGGLFASVLYGLKKFIDSLTDITKNVGGFTKGITQILDGVKGSLQAYQTQLKANALIKIAAAIGILALALMTISKIDPDKLATALTAMGMMFGELFISMAVFEKIANGPGFVAMAKLTIGMLGLSTAILILSSAVTKLSKLDWDGLAKGLTSVAVLSGILLASSKLLSANSGGMIRASLGFILFGSALLVLSTAVEKLSKIDTENLKKGLISIGALMLELSVFMKVSDLGGMGIRSSIGILIMASAMIVLADAVKKFGELDWSSLIKGLTSIGVLLGEIAIFTRMTGNAKGVISTAVSLTILGASMLILARAVGQFGNMSWEGISKGLISMAGALLIMTVALRAMPKGSFINSLALTDFATSMNVLARALTSMGNMSWEEIQKSMTVMGASIALMVIALKTLSGEIVDATALLIVTTALFGLAMVLKILGSMSLAQIGVGLLAIAGAFAIIGVAGLVLAPLTPALLGLAGAIALLGLGCLAAGVGLLAFSTALTALAVAGAAGTASLVASITAVIGLIPYAAKELAMGLLEFVQTVADNIPVIVEAIFKLLTSIMETMVNYIPKIVDTGMKLLMGFLKGIADNIQGVVEAAIDVTVNFMEGIASKLPDIIQAGFDMMLSFINGLADAIRNNTDAMINAVENLFSSMIYAGKEIIKAAVPDFMNAGANIIDGFIDGIKSNISGAADWAANMASSALAAAKGVLGINSPSKEFADVGMYANLGFAQGLKNFTNVVVSSAQDVGNSAKDALRNTISGISNIINDNIDSTPVIRPVLDMSNVNSGLGSTFGQNRTINVDSIKGKADLISSGLARRNASSTTPEPTPTQSNNPDPNTGSISVMIDKFVNNRAQDVQAFAEELEFYRMQVAMGRGGN